jgi:hypothetical protein
MKKFLNLASKALALGGLLTLMYATSGIQRFSGQEVSAAPKISFFCQATNATACEGSFCFPGKCNNTPFTNDSGLLWCCH